MESLPIFLEFPIVINYRWIQSMQEKCSVVIWWVTPCKNEDIVISSWKFATPADWFRKKNNTIFPTRVSGGSYPMAYFMAQMCNWVSKLCSNHTIKCYLVSERLSKPYIMWPSTAFPNPCAYIRPYSYCVLAAFFLIRTERLMNPGHNRIQCICDSGV